MKIILESKNITLRPSTYGDCRLFTIWEDKDYIRRYFTMNDSRGEEEITREFILRDEDPTKLQFTIVNNSNLKPIGRIYISNYNKHEASIDITRIYIGEENYLRQGYGREALNLLLEYFFNVLALERITIDFFEKNSNAKTLYQSLGFKSEGILRHVAKKNEDFINLHLMSMLSSEFKTRS